MKKFIAILVFAAGFTMQAGAQSFLSELQQKRQGEGTVTVKQSADIDNLVNNAKLKASSAQAAQNAKTSSESNTKPAEKTVARTPERTTPKLQDRTEPKRNEQKSAAAAGHDNKKEHNNGDSLAQKRQQAATERKPESGDKHTAKTATETEAPERPAVDTSKKMMRNSYKVTGYRIQAFSGGNSRADREKANQIGDAIKMKYPDQPVYVHFYSPRWICRVGNFRSYGEAAQMLRSIKAMGYKQACIVKGKITIAY